MLYLKLYMRRFNEFLQGEYHLYEPKDDPIEVLSALHRIIINGYQKYCRKKIIRIGRFQVRELLPYSF